MIGIIGITVQELESLEALESSIHAILKKIRSREKCEKEEIKKPHAWRKINE